MPQGNSYVKQSARKTVIFRAVARAALHNCGLYIKRIFRYVRSDFFLGSSFDNLVHLNACFTTWCNEVANVRRHATTGKIVDAAFEAERRASDRTATQTCSVFPRPKTPRPAACNKKRRCRSIIPADHRTTPKWGLFVGAFGEIKIGA